MKVLKETLGIKIKNLTNKDYYIPEYQTEGACGMDLRAKLPFATYLCPNDSCSIPNGIAIEIPEGYCGLVIGRSGLSRKGLHVEPLLIDQDYRGEIMTVVVNQSKERICIEPDMRISQLVIVPIAKVEWVVTDKLTPTKRGERGFGSTGLK